MTKLGAHLSIAGGFPKPLDRIKDIGGNCLQIFSHSPRGWGFPLPPPSQIDEFKKKKKELGIDPVYFHASYLVNLADDGYGGKLSVESLIKELTLASEMGIKGSIIHLGSLKENNSYKTLIKNINEVLTHTSSDTFFIIENAGTRKIGKEIKEIAQIIKDVDNDRVKVCLDTCHLHAAEYDLRTNEKLDEFIEMFDSLIGLEKLEVIHMNDSKDTFGAIRDRHENIGKGLVGIDVFRLLLNHSKIKHLPFIIETPGFDDNGPDKQNIDILKRLLA